MSGLTLGRRRLHTISNLLMLYAGKSSGVLVAFVFLPLYSRLLGAEQFGMVAIILSLQALLMMLDLGMSVIVSRDIAAADTSAAGLASLIRTAEASISGLYLLLLIGAVGFKLLGGLSAISVLDVSAIVALFWLLVLQNISYSALLARRAYAPGSIIQVAGGIVRAGATAYVLAHVSATLNAFVLTQLVFAGAHYLATRVYLDRAAPAPAGDRAQAAAVSLDGCLALLRRSKALLLTSAVGAAAMQLDKPIISLFMNAADIAPYFLAVTLSATPVGVLAAPVVQYFQPRITNDIAQKNLVAYRANMRNFVLTTIAVVLVPTILLLVFNELIVHLWLGESAHNGLVSSYSRILLCAYGIAALGYIPYVVIVARQEFAFQAKLSVGATMFVLSAVALAASRSNMALVCWAYIGYFSIATGGFLMRATRRARPIGVVA